MTEEKRVHYIAMAGLRGYIPQMCSVHPTYNEAVESAAFVHDLQWPRHDPETGQFLPGIPTLRRDGWLDLCLRVDGNEYIEIAECDCDTPWMHEDMLSPEEWEWRAR